MTTKPREPLTEESWGKLDGERVQLKDVPRDRRSEWAWADGSGIRPFRFIDEGESSLTVVKPSQE